jgi:hypothetical protein
MNEQSGCENVGPDDAQLVQAQEQWDRQPKHRRDSEHASDIERGDAIAARVPGQHQREGAGDEEQLNPARALDGDDVERPFELRHELPDMHDDHAQNGVTSQRIDERQAFDF